MLGAALAISMTQLPVWAEGEGSGGEAAAPAPAAPADQGGDQGAADPVTPPADQGAGEGAPPAPVTGGGSGSGSGGMAYGGRSTGPAPLLTLPDDPNYPVAEPPVNESLPEDVELSAEEIDAPGVFQSNVVCDPVAKPGVIAVANLLSQNYGRAGGYSLARSCIDLRSEHYDGRAVDWQLNAYDPQDRRIGDAAVTWLTENDGEVARRLGVQSIIWNSRSWHSSDRVWNGYVGQSPHTDHIHISLNWDGANMRTSWWTGVPLTEEEADQGPCQVIGGAYAAVPQASRDEACAPAAFWPTDTGYATLRPGGQGAGIGLVQPLLDVEQTGQFDDATREALLVWQGEQGVPQTGVLDQLTYAAALGWEIPELPEGALAVEVPDYAVTEYTPLKRTVLTEGDHGEDVKVLQRALDVEDDGSFGPLTAEALTAFAEEQPLLLDDLTATDTLVWQLLEQRDHPHLAYYETELEVGSTGYAVVLLQRLLELEDDGVFGPLTQQGVLDAQAAAELEPTGIVDGATWKAIDDAATARAEKEAEEAAAQEEAAKAKGAKDTKAGSAESDASSSDASSSDTSSSDTSSSDGSSETKATTVEEPRDTPIYHRLTSGAVR